MPAKKGPKVPGAGKQVKGAKPKGYDLTKQPPSTLKRPRKTK